MHKPNNVARIGKVIIRTLLFPFALTYAVISVIVLLIAYFPGLLVFMVYKSVIRALSKCVLPNSKMLHGLDNLLAHGEIYTDKSMYVCINMIFEGRMDIEQYISDWDEKTIKLKREDGTLKYPELQCYVDTWMGYSFYRQEENFDLKNHIMLFNNENLPVDRKQFNKIRNEKMKVLFPPKRSPWEITIINDFRNDDDASDGKEYSIVMFKYHHCLADGYSTLLLLLGMYGITIPKLGILDRKQKLNFLQRILVSTGTFFQCLYQIGLTLPFYSIYNPNKIYDLSTWHKPIKPKDLDLVLWSVKPFQTVIVKEISSASKATVTSVLLTACAGAFRRLMEAKGLQSPKEIFTGMSINLPDPPDRLQTHSISTRLNIPISQTGKERLKVTNERMSTLARINLMILAPMATQFIKYLPSSINIKTKKSQLFVTSSFTSVPLPNSDVDVNGCKLIGAYHNFEMTQLNASFLVSILKYKTQFFATFGIQRTILANEDEIYSIEQYLMEELNSLKSEIVSV